MMRRDRGGMRGKNFSCRFGAANVLKIDLKRAHHLKRVHHLSRAHHLSGAHSELAAPLGWQISGLSQVLTLTQTSSNEAPNDANAKNHSHL